MAKVNFKRLFTNGEVNNLEIKDGNFIVTKEGGLYIDYEDERINLMPPATILLKSLGLYEDTFDSTSDYVVGDMVFYNHTIYECTATTSGDWDASKWKIVPILVNYN